MPAHARRRAQFGSDEPCRHRRSRQKNSGGNHVRQNFDDRLVGRGDDAGVRRRVGIRRLELSRPQGPMESHGGSGHRPFVRPDQASRPRAAGSTDARIPEDSRGKPRRPGHRRSGLCAGLSVHPGRFKESTRPKSTGSFPLEKIMGVVVSAFAANPADRGLTAITAGWWPINSVTSGRIRSNLPSVQRYSMCTLRPSKNPISPSPWRNPANSFAPGPLMAVPPSR
jgi:hypothetical protein